MSPESNKISVLKDRALMMKMARAFFDERGFTEVDCPLLSDSAAIDAHIDLIEALPADGPTRYLHSSPEYGMKRLLSEGIGDIYQLSHVFRDGECGSRHNPEFMMAEWYRIDASFHDLIDETISFIRLFLGDLPVEIVTYKDAFCRLCNINPFTVEDDLLRDYLNMRLSGQFFGEEARDELLNQILALDIEPRLGEQGLAVLAYYPPSQAALAKTEIVDGDSVALRFEVYYHGIELANGYSELQDPKEQLWRLQEANRLRAILGKKQLPIDYRFLNSLARGLPQCCGVAVGFDRLMMLRHNAMQLSSVIPFSWSEA